MVLDFLLGYTTLNKPYNYEWTTRFYIVNQTLYLFLVWILFVLPPPKDLMNYDDDSCFRQMNDSVKINIIIPTIIVKKGTVFNINVVNLYVVYVIWV